MKVLGPYEVQEWELQEIIMALQQFNEGILDSRKEILPFLSVSQENMNLGIPYITLALPGCYHASAY
jgi:hypothetical protein